MKSWLYFIEIIGNIRLSSGGLERICRESRRLSDFGLKCELYRIVSAELLIVGRLLRSGFLLKKHGFLLFNLLICRIRNQVAKAFSRWGVKVHVVDYCMHWIVG